MNVNNLKYHLVHVLITNIIILDKSAWMYFTILTVTILELGY